MSSADAKKAVSWKLVLAGGILLLLIVLAVIYRGISFLGKSSSPETAILSQTSWEATLSDGRYCSIKYGKDGRFLEMFGEDNTIMGKFGVEGKKISHTVETSTSTARAKEGGQVIPVGHKFNYEIISLANGSLQVKVLEDGETISFTPAKEDNPQNIAK